MANFDEISHFFDQVDDEFIEEYLREDAECPNLSLLALEYLILQRKTPLREREGFDEAIENFFHNIVYHFADLVEEEASAGRMYLVRRMAAVAKAFETEAFLQYGYENPFNRPRPPEKAPEWEWPIVNAPPASTNGKFSGDFREFSALKLFGYTVGKTNGWSSGRRRRFLSDFIERPLPREVETYFGNEYGSPMSTDRLRKVAETIAYNCVLRKRRDARMFAQAIADWENDLDFLRQEYYEKRGMKFMPWPSTRI